MSVRAVRVFSVLAGRNRACGARAATIVPDVMSASTHARAGTAGGGGTPGARLTMTPVRASSGPPTGPAEAAAGPWTPTAPRAPSTRLSARARTGASGRAIEADCNPGPEPAGGRHATSDAAGDDRPLDLLDRLGDLDAARARLGAVEDGPAAPHTLAVVEDLQA